ncbi:hypothetical protein CLAIMM_05561 isoform 1 [Cladophialophora immunda]|nr:hypothetical protein CLAIMM_05561 isoform 1 [Cladophialophora immunda]
MLPFWLLDARLATEKFSHVSTEVVFRWISLCWYFAVITPSLLDGIHQKIQCQCFTWATSPQLILFVPPKISIFRSKQYCRASPTPVRPAQNGHYERPDVQTWIRRECWEQQAIQFFNNL